MIALLEPSKTNYLLQPGLGDLHREVTAWLNELAFCKSELLFLNKLLDKYFLRVRGQEKLSALISLEKKVKEIGRAHV